MESRIGSSHRQNISNIEMDCNIRYIIHDRSGVIPTKSIKKRPGACLYTLAMDKYSR
jgi:hypothetical protein